MKTSRKAKSKFQSLQWIAWLMLCVLIWPMVLFCQALEKRVVPSSWDNWFTLVLMFLVTIASWVGLILWILHIYDEPIKRVIFG